VREGRRCRREAGEHWFCEAHASQIPSFALGAITAITLNYTANHLPLITEIFRVQEPFLSASDFRVSMFVSANPNAYNADLNYKPPDRLRFYLNIGPVQIVAELIRHDPPAPEYKSSRNPNRVWYYVDPTPTVLYFNSLKYSDLM
jgi:hypothetical protein